MPDLPGVVVAGLAPFLGFLAVYLVGFGLIRRIGQ